MRMQHCQIPANAKMIAANPHSPCHFHPALSVARAIAAIATIAIAVAAVGWYFSVFESSVDASNPLATPFPVLTIHAPVRSSSSSHLSRLIPITFPFISPPPPLLHLLRSH